MKLIVKALLASSILFCAQAIAWDPAAPVRGWVDTYVDRCPSGAAQCGPLKASRFEAQGWACSNPALGGTFDPNKLSILAVYNGWIIIPPTIRSIEIQGRPDVVAYGACPTSAVGFKIGFDYGNGWVLPYNQFRIMYDGVPLEPNQYLFGGPR